jgi:hypothetical protein
MTMPWWEWLFYGYGLLVGVGLMAGAFGPIIRRWPAQTVALLAVLLYVYAVLR